MIGIGIHYGKPSRSAPSGAPQVPSNAILDEDGEPILDENGDYILEEDSLCQR